MVEGGKRGGERWGDHAWQTKRMRMTSGGDGGGDTKSQQP